MTVIDVHSQFLPRGYTAAMAAASLTHPDGFPTPPWSEAAALALMDEQHIAASVLSLSSPGLAFAPAGRAADLARAVNDEAAALVGRHPRRFGALGFLPLPNIDASLSEIDRIYDDLGLDGVGLLTNYGGVYLGDSQFEPVFAALNRRRAVVQIHPTSPPAPTSLALGFPAPMLEFPFDTLRAVANLLRADTLARHPALTIILTHAGGALPFLAPRLAPFLNPKSLPDPAVAAERLTQMRGFYLDLTAACHPSAFAALAAFIPASRLMLGFDHPFMPAAAIAPAQRALATFTEFDDDERAAIREGTARRLFPRLSRRMDG